MVHHSLWEGLLKQKSLEPGFWSKKAFVANVFLLPLRWKCVLTCCVSVCRCYTCDSDIPVEVSKRIQECVDFLRKQAGLPRTDLSHFGSKHLPFVQLLSVAYITVTLQCKMFTIFSECKISSFKILMSLKENTGKEWIGKPSPRNSCKQGKSPHHHVTVVRT